MRHLLCLTVLAAFVGTVTAAHAASRNISVTVDGVSSGKPIPAAQALCTPTADGKSDKVKAITRPTIRWSGVPKDTGSIAVFMMDPDVPADFTDAGKDGKVLPKDSARKDFFHYGVVGLPATASSIAGGDATKALVEGTELTNDLGLNGYVDPPSSYGGPCPPWNDERLHHYHFIVLALAKDAPLTAWARNKTPRQDDPNTAKNSFDRLMASKYVLAKGAVVGTYTLNATLKP